MPPLFTYRTLRYMDTVKCAVATNNPEETEAIARQIGASLRGGEVIELISDLGGGKTTFTKGLVAGLGSDDVVASPTFTISKEYTNGRLRVCHFDFYRLQEAGIVADELAEVINEPMTVVVVEWADIVSGVLPEYRLRVVIRASGEMSRQFNLEVPEELSYLLEGVKQC